MTVAGSTAALTKVINDTTKELEITEASLDAKVTAVQASEAAAGADKTEAEGYRDEAAAHAVSVAGDLTTVQGNVTYEGISAILAEKAVTAVDVFVYDTSLDSDGGAWRKRTQHTSWYNEALNTATRGARRGFPAIAVIVAEAGKVTIYDGDDPSLPMWRLWNAGSGQAVGFFNGNASSVAAKNGVLFWGSTADSASLGGAVFVSFTSDEVGRIASNNAWGGRGLVVSASSVVSTILPTRNTTAPIVNSAVNDVAMAVLPDAPVDSATGLPVPTIAVATNGGGLSVIKHDGTVVDLLDFYGGYGVSSAVQFLDDGQVAFTLDDIYIRNGYFGPIPSVDTLVNKAGFAGDNGFTNFGRATQIPELLAGTNGLSLYSKVLRTPGGFSVFGSRATAGRVNLARVWLDPTQPTRPMVAKTTTKHTTGWLTDGTKGAWLADTDDTDLVGPGELVTNGTFDDASWWGTDASWTIADGVATVTGNDQIYSPASWVASAVPVLISFDVTQVDTAGNLVVIATSPASQSVNITTTGTYTVIAYFNTVDRLRFGSGSNSSFRGSIDNISVREMSPDRSVNNNGLIVNGTITRSPVADGAELVGYSGFSAANYLEQRYNSALDFGIGDFCVMGWAKESAASDWLVDRMEGRDGSNSLHGFNLWQNTQSLRFDVYENNSATSVLATTVMGSSDPLWYFFAAVRRKGALEMYINGVLEAITNGPDRNTNYTGVGAPPPLIIGARAPDGGASWLNGHAALIRISATAPTPNQIGKIYEDERKLFMPGAQCTLYGTSDAVTALAHDPKTNLLHVGTSAGRSVFDGLQRVAHTETPVTTAISAAGGLIVEE